MKHTRSPGCSVPRRLWLPMGAQPLATLFALLFSNTARGSPKPLYAPRKLSRSVSKPSIGAFTA